mgnify:CR=1 FL=1
MLTGKALFNELVSELNDMGLPGMSATLDEMFRSSEFLNLDPLMAIAMLVEPEYQKKINKRIQGRLRAAHLRGCPQEISSCVDSADREYLPRGITETLSSLDFIASGMKEKKIVDGKEYMFELPLKPKFSLVRADFCDKFGNFAMLEATKNFNHVMAMAAEHTILASEKVFEIGEKEPDFYQVSGVLVEKIVEGEPAWQI